MCKKVPVVKAVVEIKPSLANVTDIQIQRDKVLQQVSDYDYRRPSMFYEFGAPY